MYCAVQTSSARPCSGLRPGTRVLAPKLVEDIRPHEAEGFLKHLSEWARRQAPQALLILRDAAAPDLGPVPTRFGWALDEAVAQYRTDLTQTRHVLDPAVTEVPREEWTAPEFAAAFAPIFETWGEADGESAADHLADLLSEAEPRLFAVSEAGQVVACAALRIMDAGPHGVSAQITMYGVRPDRRGAGFGQRLHAHLLAMASGQAPKHEGATDQGNLAMRRILERNGAVLTGLQRQYRLT